MDSSKINSVKKVVPRKLSRTPFIGAIAISAAFLKLFDRYIPNWFWPSVLVILAVSFVAAGAIAKAYLRRRKCEL